MRLGFAPLPARRGPYIAGPVAAGVDELEKLRVGNVVHVNLERVHVDAVLAKLVVPAEGNRRAVGAKRCRARWDVGGLARRAAAALVAESRRDAFLLGRQPVPHVEQRLLVHRLVLEGREDGLATPHGEVLAAGQVERRTAKRVYDGLVRAAAERQHVLARRPDCPCAAAGHRVIDTVGIDAALEETLHPRIDTRQPEPTLQEGNHAEGWQVTFIKDDGIAEGNGTRVVRVRVEEVEQLPRSVAVAPIPVDEACAINGDGESCGGQGFPFQRARS